MVQSKSKFLSLPSLSPMLLDGSEVWSSLRLALGLLHRPDLQAACEARDLQALNREFGLQQSEG